MPSLVKKKVKGKAYYYLVWSARVDGKPRTVRQIYLGSAEQVASRLSDQVEPVEASKNSYTAVREFGASAALYALCQKLGVADIIDAHVKPKKRGVLSVGHYMTISAINRCISPASKSAIGEWFQSSILSALIPARRKEMQAQRFWDAMDAVTEKNIRDIELSLLKRVQQLYEIDLSRLTFDATNFFTFIKTTNKCELPQRGHNKAKRDDLRQVSLAILASLDFGVPLFHDCYAGNVADSKAFAADLDPMIERLQQLGAVTSQVTLVFDKGNNSEANFHHIDRKGCHYVGSLPPSQHKDLMAVPLSSFVPLTGRLRGVKAYRTKKSIYGKTRTVVLTWNPKLASKQEAALLRYLEKKTAALRDIQDRLKRMQNRKKGPTSRTTVKTVTREVGALLSNNEVRQCFKISVQEVNGLPTLEFSVNDEAVNARREQLYGRNFLVTDHDDWGDEDIVQAYRWQYKLESQFKTMKDPHGLSWWPRFHWTDQKIRVHAFYCVLGLLLVSLLQRELATKGMHIPIPKMLRKLREIQEHTLVLRDDQTRIRTVTSLSKMTTAQRRLFAALNLKRFAKLSS